MRVYVIVGIYLYIMSVLLARCRGKAIWRLCSVKPQRCEMGSEALRHRSRQDHPIEHRRQSYPWHALEPLLMPLNAE